MTFFNSKNLKPYYMMRLSKNYMNFYQAYSDKVKIDRSALWCQPAGYNSGIKIYNPILKGKVDLVLKNKGIATWYSCGPTVYDSAHIGHASCYMKFDIIRRILEEWFNINTVMVMGITDIDDKIIMKANELNTDARLIATKYEVEFLKDIYNLNLLPPTLIAKVTDYIPVIINFINKILAKGFAYTTSSGSVYFRTDKYKRYNKFGLALLESSFQEFQNMDEQKQSSLDFALWKAAKPGEPFWESPWGFGRPGWHIECSAIASAVFGCNIDLHSGGIDLKFPHHENEEAQSCIHHCVDQWVNYWMHSGHLHFQGGEKMSKSLKNTLSIADFLQTYTANDFRIFCLMSPYRNSVEYSDDAIKTASAIYRKIESFIHTSDAYIKGQLIHGAINDDVLLQELEETKEEIFKCFIDDFNTPQALSRLLSLISTTNEMIYTKSETVVRSPVAVAAVSNFVKESFVKFGFNFDLVQKDLNSEMTLTLSNVLDAAVDFRCNVKKVLRSSGQNLSEDEKTRRKKLFQSCDDFRSNLINMGIELQDHGEKSSWKFTKNVVQKNNSSIER